MLLLAVPVFKVKTRRHVEALPKRAPDGHSPLNSLLKFIYQHCVQCYHIIRQSWQKHTSEKLARVWCFQQHSRAPSRSKISPLRSWKAYSPPPPNSSPKIVPPHWPQTSVFKESEHRCCPILPQRTSVRNPPNKLPQRLSPTPKILRSSKHYPITILPRISQSSCPPPTYPFCLMRFHIEDFHDVCPHKLLSSRCFHSALSEEVGTKQEIPHKNQVNEMPSNTQLEVLKSQNTSFFESWTSLIKAELFLYDVFFVKVAYLFLGRNSEYFIYSTS